MGEECIGRQTYSLKRIHILVEGQTEETFVRDLLVPYLEARGVYLSVILASTRRVRSGHKFKGGVTKYSHVKRDLLSLLGGGGVVGVTTMIDYYGLPDDFPGFHTRLTGNCYHRVQHMEDAFYQDIAHERFKPFLTLHEFEALLFSDTGAFSVVVDQERPVLRLARVRSQFGSPEEINEGPNTNPAARIRDNIPNYQKLFHGILVAKRIGLTTILQECRHFREWVEWLENV